MCNKYGLYPDLFCKFKPYNELDTASGDICWVEEGRAQSSSGGAIVRILTMQSAKGLQADTVFILGITENIVPAKGSSEEDSQEARRLLYVSMTRARRQLFLFHARKRSAKVTYLKSGKDHH